MRFDVTRTHRHRLPGGLAGTVLLLLLAPMAMADDLEGTWFAESDADRDEPDRLHLELRSGEQPSWRRQTAMTLSVSELQGLTREQVEEGTGPLTFQLVREPGTLSFDGRFHDGTGSGRFTFTMSEEFDAALRKRGFRGIRTHEYQAMALQDVTLAWLDELQGLGFDDLEVDDVLALSVHGADADFVRELQELGFDSRDIDDWVAMRIHGVDAAFVRDMRQHGGRSDDPDDYVGMRIHQVTPGFLAEMRDLGYDLSFEEGQSFRIHGVDAEFIAEMTDLLGPRLDAEELLAMRIHGVNADFVRELRDMGYDDLTAEELVELRIHGVDSRALRRWNRHRDGSHQE